MVTIDNIDTTRIWLTFYSQPFACETFHPYPSEIHLKSSYKIKLQVFVILGACF